MGFALRVLVDTSERASHAHNLFQEGHRSLVRLTVHSSSEHIARYHPGRRTPVLCLHRISISQSHLRLSGSTVPRSDHSAHLLARMSLRAAFQARSLSSCAPFVASLREMSVSAAQIEHQLKDKLKATHVVRPAFDRAPDASFHPHVYSYSFILICGREIYGLVWAPVSTSPSAVHARGFAVRTSHQ